MRTRFYAIVGLFILISYLSLSFSHFLTSRVGGHDESIQLMGGFLISRGFCPHKDFWSMYTPLNYYLNSLSFYCMGMSAISARILQEFLFAAFLIGCYFGFKIVSSRGSYFSVSLTLISSILAARVFTYAWWNPYALGLIGMLLYLFSVKKRSSVLLFASGTMIGLASLGKLNFGSYMAAGILSAFATEALRGSTGVPPVTQAKRLCYFLLPVLGCFLFYLVPYGAFAKEVLYQIVIFPSQSLEQHRILSLPEGLQGYGVLFAAVFPLIWMIFRSIQVASKIDLCAVIAFLASILSMEILSFVGTQYQHLLPQFIVLTGFILILLQFAFHRVEESEFALLMAYVFFTNYFLSRIDPPHFSVLIPLGIFLSFNILKRQVLLRAPVIVKISSYASGVLILALCVSPAYWHLKQILQQPDKNLSEAWQILNHRWQFGNRSDSELLMSVRSSAFAPLYPDKAELQAARFVANHTRTDDPVYVGLKDHSTVYMSPLRLCWILGRNIGVKYFLLEPGLTTEEPIQHRMIDELKAKNVEWMILQESRRGDQDFQTRNYRGSSILDRYIMQNYEAVQEFDSFSVYKRKASSS
ncbi:hypothetical protein L0156_19095 [bacterium]|nr:hypothetical protein [bacterium]